MLTQDDPMDAPGRARPPRRPRRGSPRTVIAQATAVMWLGLIAGSLFLARDTSVLSVTAVVLIALGAGAATVVGLGRAASASRPAPRSRINMAGRRRSRRVVAGTAMIGLLLIAVIVRFDGWAVLAIGPAISTAALVARGSLTSPRIRPTRRWWWLVVLAALSPWLWSFESTLVAANSDPVSVRAVEWARDHGFAGVVDDVEHWWYTRHLPPVGGRPAQLTLPARTGGPRRAAVPAVDPSLVTVPTPAGHPIGSEGQWAVTAGSPARPAVATTLVRPDPIHTSLVVGLLRIDPRYVRLRLLSGTQQPGGPSSNGAMVPLADRAALVAAFNAGFRMTESHGGWYSDGRTVEPLRVGAASLVFYDDGHADVGVWGRDDLMGPHVTAVRQNLALIVDGGHAVPGIDDSANALWGRTVGHRVLVSRSGIGITATGALIYVGGPGLSVQTLANTLLAAGAVRAMELDINTTWVEAYTFRPSPAGPVGTKLVDAMEEPPSHYLAPETRDFVEVTLRPDV